MLIRFRRSLTCIVIVAAALLAPNPAMAVPNTVDLGLIAQTARLADWLLDLASPPFSPQLVGVLAADGGSSGGSSGGGGSTSPDGGTLPEPDDGGAGNAPDPNGYV